MLLMVFNSGFELRLADWRRIVAAERREIWLDVHSLVLAKVVGVHRDYVAVPGWRDWIAGVSYLQANRQEVASLRGHPERWPSRAEIESFAAQAFDVGVRAVFVTMGKDGVLLLTPGAHPSPVVRHIQAPAADRVVDTTGCGDVFCAAAMRLLSRGASIEEAAKAGVALASEAVGLAGIAETFALAASLVRAGSPG
jgi:sugar/nucleoside kinase (ribokinase family)